MQFLDRGDVRHFGRPRHLLSAGLGARRGRGYERGAAGAQGGTPIEPARRPRRKPPLKAEESVSAAVPEAAKRAAAGEVIHKRIARDLGVDILAGRYAAGAVLPNEVEASARLKISRTAYREAIRILAAKGLVESRPKSRTVVSPGKDWNILDPDVLDWMFVAGPSAAFILSLFELRRIVEPAAAALAAERRTAAQLGQMGHALEEILRHGFETREGQLADRRFHEQVLAATGNPALMALTRTISTTVEATTRFKQRKRPLVRDAAPEHRSLFEAIVERDPERARAASLELIDLAMLDLRRGVSD